MFSEEKKELMVHLGKRRVREKWCERDYNKKVKREQTWRDKEIRYEKFLSFFS